MKKTMCISKFLQACLLLGLMVLSGLTAAEEQSNLRNKIEEISQPVVLIHGESDIITHPSAARWMHQKLPSSELLMLSNCGHAPFLSHPDQFITKLIQTV